MPMKKLLLFISTLTSSIALNAQSSLTVIDVNNGMATVPHNSVIDYTTAPSDHLTTEIDAQNTSSSTKYYKLRRFDDVLNTGASAYFCVGGANCYGPATTVSPITVTLTPNQKLSDLNKSLLLDLEEDVTPGYSSIRYEIFEINDANDVISFTLRYNYDLTSVKENKALFSSVSNVFPSPASNKANIYVSSSLELNNVSVSLTNSLGSVVLSKSISLSNGKNNIALDIDNLPSGVYFASISYGNSKLVKKFIINK